MKRRIARALIGSLAALMTSCVAPKIGRQASPTLASPTSVVAPVPSMVPTAGSINVFGRPTQGSLVSGILQKGATDLTLDGLPVRVAPDGRFIIAFGQEAGPDAMLRAKMPDGRFGELRLQVEARSWRIENIPSVPRFAQPSAEFARLRPPELAQINAARQVESDAEGWR